jgi:diguanylate cyclase (GGDEF)-like protein
MNHQLVERIRNTPNLPTLPAIAMQVLELAQKPEADLNEIARLISKDPALSGKILRTVNSSFYGRSQNVSTISHALVILGLQSVKTLVLGFSLVSNLSNNKAKGFKHVKYWKRSIYAATAARVMAKRLGLVQAEEAFLTALLQDIGMLVLDMVVPEEYRQIHEQVVSHRDLAAAELAKLDMTHADATGVLAESWKLPPILAVPIANHHCPGQVTDPLLRKMTDLIGLAGICADVFVDEEAAPAIADVRQIMLKDHQISEADCDAILSEIGNSTKEVAGLFEINIGASQKFDVILEKAREALVSLTLQTQMAATQLQEQNQQLKQEAVTDGLTGLANRKHFDQFIEQQVAAALRSNQHLSLVMFDIDKFKSINDTHGHQAGDEVIRTMSKLLRSVSRKQDLAARYGGEEMVLCLPNTPRAVAAAIAETIRKGLEARTVTHERKTIRVTTSAGVASIEPGSPLRTAAQVLKAADAALYHAKHSGRNCVKVFAPRKAA